jgi:uncharacterized membrane protein
MKRWQRDLFVVAVAAGLLHLLFVWGLPRFIVMIARTRIARMAGPHQIHHAELPTASWRTVVMPSPDQLYSACAYDVSEHPLLLTADTADGYWSVSAFADNTDNFFALNDRQVRDHHARVTLTSDPSYRDPEGGQVVQVPTTKGVVLFRLLVLDKANLPALERIQHSARCTPVL